MLNDKIISNYIVVRYDYRLYSCFKKNYYLSFEKVAGINSVKVLDKIPVEYRLNRDDYTIRLRLDEKSGLRLYINSEDMNAIPLAINAKPGGLIYRYTSGDNKGKFDYTKDLIVGNEKEVNTWLAINQVPDNAVVVANFHSHPLDYNDPLIGHFSTDDILLTDYKKYYDSYVVAPDGSIDYYSPVTNKLFSIGDID